MLLETASPQLSAVLLSEAVNELNKCEMINVINSLIPNQSLTKFNLLIAYDVTDNATTSSRLDRHIFDTKNNNLILLIYSLNLMC